MFKTMKDRIRETEKEAILEALTECNGNRSKAAFILGINRDTLYERLKEFGIPAKLQIKGKDHDNGR